MATLQVRALGSRRGFAAVATLQVRALGSRRGLAAVAAGIDGNHGAVGGWAPGSAAGELAADGAGLAGPVEEAGEVLAGGVVVEIDLDLDDAEAGAEGVDGHGDLDPEAGGEREQGGEGLPADGALAGEGLGHGAAGGPGHAAPGQAHGHAEPAGALLGGEVGDGQVGLAGQDRVEQAAEPGRGLGQVGVGQEQGRRLGAEPLGDPSHEGGQAGVEGSALADVAGQVEAVGPGLQGPVRGGVVRPVTHHQHLGHAGEPAQRPHGRPDPLGLVPGRDQRQHHRATVGLGVGLGKPLLVGGHEPSVRSGRRPEAPSLVPYWPAGSCWRLPWRAWTRASWP